MFGFAITPVVKYIAAISALVILFGYGYYEGHSHMKQKFDTYKAEVTAVAAQQEAKTQVIEEKAAKITKETSNAYKTNLNTVRSYYDGLRHTESSSNLSKVSSTTAGTNARPTYDVLAGQCAETTLQIVSLQNFIKSISESY